MPNPYRDPGFQITNAARLVLEKSGLLVKTCIPFRYEHVNDCPPGLHFVPVGDALQDCEALVCLGGDGTILHSARLVGTCNIPLLGINTGTLGFMAELEKNELGLLSKLASDDYTVDTRMMIHVAVNRGGRIIYEDNALNDAVITKGAVARVIQLTVSCDGEEAMLFDGDGVVLCTPTGTTAYSMSAGGPVVEPGAHNLIVTPICAHSMSNHSLILSREKTVDVAIGRIGRRNAFLSVDGGRAFKLFSEDRVVMTESKRVTRLIRLKNVSFYSILNRKFQGA